MTDSINLWLIARYAFQEHLCATAPWMFSVWMGEIIFKKFQFGYPKFSGKVLEMFYTGKSI